MRLKRGGYLGRGPYHESHPLYRLAIADMDRLERVRATLDYLQQRPEQLNGRAYAEFHFEPAVRSLITKEANGTHRILPGLAVVIEISQVGGLFNVTLAHSRSARGYPEFSAKEPELSETQMVQLCNFMIVDYTAASPISSQTCAHVISARRRHGPCAHMRRTRQRFGHAHVKTLLACVDTCRWLPHRSDGETSASKREAS